MTLIMSGYLKLTHSGKARKEIYYFSDEISLKVICEKVKFINYIIFMTLNGHTCKLL